MIAQFLQTKTIKIVKNTRFFRTSQAADHTNELIGLENEVDHQGVYPMMHIHRIITLTLILLTMSYFASCKGGGGGGSSSTADTSPATPPADPAPVVANNIEFKTFDVTKSVAAGKEVTLNLEIATDDNSVVFYQISDHEEVKFKPNAGIIVPKNKRGTLITTLKTDEPGTYDFSVTLTNTQNQKSKKDFS